MITFVLAEAELERIPRDILSDRTIQERSKRRKRPPAELVLDQATDFRAMRALEDGDRRGRPDIAHFWLMLVLDSIVNKKGQARLFIHTRHDQLIRVRADTRIMRNQAKFYQLLEDLFRQGEVPVNDPLLTIEPQRTLKSVLAAEAQGTKVLLDVGGERARSPRFEQLARAGDLTIVMGGFPRGEFRQAKREWFDHVIRVSDDELTVWSALVPVLAGLEDGLDDPSND